MDYFSEIPEGQAIICSGGVYRQVKISARSGKVYAKYGGGYVRLLHGGQTSHPKITWLQIDAGDGAAVENGMAVSYVPPRPVAAQ